MQVTRSRVQKRAHYPIVAQICDGSDILSNRPCRQYASFGWMPIADSNCFAHMREHCEQNSPYILWLAVRCTGRGWRDFASAPDNTLPAACSMGLQPLIATISDLADESPAAWPLCHGLACTWDRAGQGKGVRHNDDVGKFGLAGDLLERAASCGRCRWLRSGARGGVHLNAPEPRSRSRLRRKIGLPAACYDKTVDAPGF